MDFIKKKKKRTVEYKILTQKDKWISGKFNPESLEIALNSYAEQGWRFVGCAAANIRAIGDSRQEFIAVLERNI